MPLLRGGVHSEGRNEAAFGGAVQGFQVYSGFNTNPTARMTITSAVFA